MIVFCVCPVDMFVIDMVSVDVMTLKKYIIRIFHCLAPSEV